MNKVLFHPAFIEAIKETQETDEQRARLQVVLEPPTFERVCRIVEGEAARKRAAFYGTIFEAACAGEDFSKVESIRDIADIYARFVVRGALG
jgi:hypothetical protein